MPYKAGHNCGVRSCPVIVKSGGGAYCPAHRKQAQKDYPRRNPITNRIYGSRRWLAFRKMYLARHPLCTEKDCTYSATVVHHITDHKGDPNLLWDENNMRALCKVHHDRIGGQRSSWGKNI